MTGTAHLKPESEDPLNKTTKEQEKNVPFSCLKEHDYNLTDRMGTLLASEKKVNFESFENTIAAYRVAFGDEIKIILDQKHNACANVSVLEAIRNIFAHRGGKIDSRFTRRIKRAHGSSFG